MQDIKKECDKCKEKEAVKKTMENPNPEESIKNVKLAGRGKNLDSLQMDLCLNCHVELKALTEKWVTGTASLQDF